MPKPRLRFLLLALLTLPALAATRVSLNGDWRFRIEGQPEESVRVPHTWGIGKHDGYIGTAAYTRTFNAPAELRQKHVELHFGATFYKSRVKLNGQLLGEHEGGYTEYFFPISAQLKESNTLEVEVNNEPSVSTIPGYAMRLADGNAIWYDWWHYGGIVRDVWLQVSEPVFVRRQQIRTRLDGAAAEVTTMVFVENNSGKPQPVNVRAEVLREGKPVSAAAQSGVSLAAGAGKLAPLVLKLTSPALWHFDSPNLYTLRVDLSSPSGVLLDTHESTFGVRKVEIRDNRLLLNGEPVRLSGITRHEDSPWEGLAETRGTILQDYRDLKSLQSTLTRPVHYPQHPDVLDFCDRNGILLSPEIPIWQFSEAQLKDPRVRTLARNMLTEMVTEAYNHPSIYAWSVCNESETMKAGGVEYFKEMYAMLKALDPDRFVSYADDAIGAVKNPSDYAAAFADYIMMNQYYGSWHGPAEGLSPALDRVHKAFPDKMVVISEFGLAAPFAPNAAAGDVRRIEILKSQMEEFARRPWIGAAIFWCYQDYRSHRNLWPGLDDGVVDMGIVDENRQRKPSYFAWKERNSPVSIESRWQGGGYTAPSGFSAGIGRRGETELPSYELHGYRLEWEARDERGTLLASGQRALPTLGASVTEEGKWTPPQSPMRVTLTLRVFRPTGIIAAEKTVNWTVPAFGNQTIDAMKKAGLIVP